MLNVDALFTYALSFSKRESPPQQRIKLKNLKHGAASLEPRFNPRPERK
jgi:hypothetical protein